VELENGDVFKYKGNYQYYLEKKAEREANLASELEKDRNTYRRELDWVRRMPKARGTKSKSRVEAFDNLEDKIKQQRHKSELNITMRMERLGAKILELHHVKKAFGEVKILNDFSYVFKRKEKVGIIGRNGAGKSTLLNIIMQLETPDSGKVVIGDTIGFGYYSQQGMKIDDSRKVIDEVRDVADWIPMANGNKLTASQLLFQFGFDYDKQFDFVSKLSGGERRRLFLMKILMAAPNFLILDEPTNDLDIQTLSVLEDFLLSYDGCVIIVSHDRFFMDKLVDHCFIFEGEGEVRDFPGNYSDYRDWEELQELSLAKTGQKVNIKLETEIKPEPKEISASVSVDSKVETKKLTFKEKFELEQIEKEIPELQQKKSSLLQELSSLTTQYDRIAQLGQEVEALQERLDLLEFRWLELSD
jgi:ATP-binding cassette subfamily F protein uup